MIRDLLARLVYRLRGLSEKERHRRKTANAIVGRHRPDLSRRDAAEVAEFESLVHEWRTDEQPIVSYDHPEPIGPAERVLYPALFLDVVRERTEAGVLSSTTAESFGLTAELTWADVQEKLARGKAMLERALKEAIPDEEVEKRLAQIKATARERLADRDATDRLRAALNKLVEPEPCAIADQLHRARYHGGSPAPERIEKDGADRG